MIEKSNLPIDKKQETTTCHECSHAQAASKGTAQSKKTATVPDASKEAKEFRSFGKIAHNELTYRGADWFLNSAIGVTFAFLAQRTKVGREWFSIPVANFFKKILSPVLKSEAAREEGAQWGSMITGIMAGGTAITPILMTLENKKNKKGIIRWIDELWYGKKEVENNPKFEESYKAIDEEPHKGFWIGMGSRFLALAPIIAAVSYWPINKQFIKHIYDPIGNSTKWAAMKVGIKPSENMLNPLKGALEHLEGDPNIAKQWQSNWDFLHRTIGFDFGLTILYSVLHEITYKGLARIGMKTTKDDKPSSSKPTHVDSAEPTIAPPSSVATEVELLESSIENEEKNYKKQSLSSYIKPKNSLVMPKPLHAQKIESEAGQPTLAI